MSSTVLILAGSRGSAPKPQSMGIRLSENFFQRWVLIVLPILIMGAIGAMMTQRVTDTYRGAATIDASPNTFLDERPDIGGLSATGRESTAEATARVLNERLRTDRFAAGVAERAGLAEAVDKGFLGYDDLRGRITIFATGDSLVDFEATWSDPDTTIRLIDATIAQYLSVLETSATADAQSAVDFFEVRQVEAAGTVESASAELDAFLSELGVQLDGDELAITDNLQLQRLNTRLINAQAAIDDADAAIENAHAVLEGARRDAVGSVEMIDPPFSTFVPESTLMNRLILFVAFLLLGFLISLTILVLSTYLDRSVRSAADIEAAGGGVTVAAVPMIRSLRPPSGLQRARGGVSWIFNRVRRAA